MREVDKTTRVYEPSDLNLDAFNTASPATFTGSYVNISAYDKFMFLLECSNTSVAGHVRFSTKLSDGSTDSGYMPLRGTTAYPFVFGGRVVVVCTPERGLFMGVDATLPSLAATFAGLELVRFQIQVTTGGAGTGSAYLYCKRGPIAIVG